MIPSDIGGRGGGIGQCLQMTQGGGGLNLVKKCYVLFDLPITCNIAIILASYGFLLPNQGKLLKNLPCLVTREMLYCQNI